MDKNRSTIKIQKQFVCALCNKQFNNSLGSHIQEEHGEEALHKIVLRAKEHGMPDAEIGARYGISFATLEQIVTNAYGANISVLKKPKHIKRWEPPNFREETTTVWSFKQRGDWVTHDGRYRGNWSPYIPRNLILKYSRPGDVVLDYFVGGGTTAVEAKLLGRRCIAKDINPGAVGITLENLKFSPPHHLVGNGALPQYEPEVSVGDARDLSDIPDSSIDLICAHPPYAGIIKYSVKIPGDLSDLSVQDFLVEMRKVARESLRVLKPGGKCAILVGDARKSKHVVPIGFQTIRVFLDEGFILKELVIKRQHNCKTTGFWYTRSIKHNFLLLAHEYLPIFEKPRASRVSEQETLSEQTMPHHTVIEKVQALKDEDVETTTVWIFPPDQLEAKIQHNLLRRFATPGTKFVEVVIDGELENQQIDVDPGASLVYIAPPNRLIDDKAIEGYCSTVKRLAEQASHILQEDDFLVVDTRDVRIEGLLRPMGLMVWETMLDQTRFAIKEIVIVVLDKDLEPSQSTSGDNHLQITSRYLLIYRRRHAEEFES